MAMLEVKNLEVYYGVIQAIKGISFEVNEGEVIALIGANGAGKTTTLQTITGMLKPEKGEVIFNGVDIADPKVNINIHRKSRDIRLFPWEWHMYRREDVCLHSFQSMRT